MSDEQKNSKDLIEQISAQQQALPLEEQESYLIQTREKLEDDRRKWVTKKRDLEASLANFPRLNDSTVDEAMAVNYLEKGAGSVENESFASKPIERKSDHLEVSIAKFRRLIENTDRAIGFCGAEASRVHKRLTAKIAERATSEAIQAIDDFISMYQRAESVFDVMAEKVRRIYDLDSGWHVRAHRFGPFYAAVAGLNLLKPSNLDKTSMSGVVEGLRRQRVEGNPLQDGKERRAREKRPDMYRGEFHGETFGTERPGFEKALNDLTKNVMNA